MSEEKNDIQVVVAIDFGTTYSGYAFAHKLNPDEIVVQNSWKEYESRYKTPTVIKYNDSYTTIKSWGYPALAERPRRTNASSSSMKIPKPSSCPIELFKLHLSRSLKDEEKPFLPNKFDYKNAIKEFMKKLGDDIKENLKRRWRNFDFYKNVLIVLSVPAEFDDTAIAIFRECVSNAGLLNDKNNNLKITTEPEAAAIYCLRTISRREYRLEPGASFMIVDCGGGTVDLTTRELLEDEKLSEITERTGDFCGSSYIDQAFLEFFSKIVGKYAIELVKTNHYGQLQYLVQEFCKRVKLPFTGREEDMKQPFEFDIKELLPIIQKYVKEEEKNKLNESEWCFEIKFEDIKAMFDLVIDKIINLISEQLKRSEKKCSAMFLVGGFSESKYLQTRIKKEFGEIVSNISVPPNPITSVVKGGVLYGLREEIIKDRVLKRTYGTDIARRWMPSDPLPQKLPNGTAIAFETLLQRGKKISINEKVVKKFRPLNPLQKKLSFNVYVTDKEDTNFCNDIGVNLLRNWEIELPDNQNLEDIEILFTLTFNTIEILATAENQKTGKKCQVKFEIE